MIHRGYTPEKLEEHLGLFHSSYWPEIAIEPQANTPEIQTWLSNRGFSPAYDHEFLELQASHYQAIASASESISIEHWDHSKADDFLALLKTSGLECTDDIWNDKRSLYCTDTFRCYIATIDGKPCAWTTSYLHNDHGILANAYTQESHRHKGCQSALLRFRIEDAISLGIQVLLTDVMPNSTSSKNCKSVEAVS
ncbi:GNAT family N-acetyltransferase [Bacterioplanes sanyensis]|uniref:GNAT family N-acetyltransferase n=1 Tax=Bacterioplanes sanyensis TaxID=1249553 RepID=UPI001E3DA019|nr:GNAT family N-acetyltransferase [Bacterioplanes sanyensis]